MSTIRVRFVLLLSLVAVAPGCTASATAPYTPITNSPFGAKVQLAVGTANIFGDATTRGVAVRGLNVVVTSRQPAGYQTPGDTLPLVDTPALEGAMNLPKLAGVPDPFGAAVETGPGPTEAGGDTMRGTPQQNAGAPSIPPSTFGVSGGATGLGIEPFNYTVAGGNGFGQPASWVPWTAPFFDHHTINGGDPNAFVPWGGPPAYDPFHDGKGVRDGNGEPPGVLGVELGLDVFENVAVHSGTFMLTETIQTTTTTGSVRATARLHSTALLPAIAAPDDAKLDGNGGGTFTLDVPAGVSEAYLQIVDTGPEPEASSSGSTVQPLSCNTAAQSEPVYYTFLARGAGKHSFVLTDFAGPGAPHSAVPSLCTQADNIAANASGSSSFSTVSADVFTVQAVGYDYPAFEANYPQSLGNPLPALTGNGGQSDVTISSAKTCTQGASTAVCAPATRALFGSRR